MPELTDRSWRREAACGDDDDRSATLLATFPRPSDEEAAEAKRICSSCPVEEECLLFALSNGERYGVWGGTTPSEREDMRADIEELTE